MIAGYLSGSIPSGWLMCKILGNKEIRDFGSGNTGATNVMRVLGKWPAIVTLLVDILKGSTVVLIAKLMFPEAIGVHCAVAILAVMGHIYPLWLKFEGGKGVATSLGVFVIIDPIATGLAVLTFIVVVLITKYVSLSSLSGAASFPIWILVTSFIRGGFHLKYILTGAIVAVILFYTHQENIERLMEDNEYKVGEKVQSSKKEGSDIA